MNTMNTVTTGSLRATSTRHGEERLVGPRRTMIGHPAVRRLLTISPRKGGALPTAPVLLVEDETGIVELFATILREEGYAVQDAVALDAAAALLDRCGPHAFDLALSAPCVSPHQNPYAWLERLRAATRTLIVICGRAPATR
ncbi:MAG: hypothetical protein M3Y74_24190 [Chloroflexota bacterium]|nr:hypothetical protein [Chloroflexota bacterium]